MTRFHRLCAGLAVLAVAAWWLPSPAREAAWLALAGILVATAAYGAVRLDSDLLGPCITTGPTSAPAFALTFDDGPGPGTDDVLALLELHGAPATFFLIGRNAEGDPERVGRIAAAGHQIANHSYRHRPWLPFAPRAVLQRDMERCQATLAALAPRPTYYRPPYGVRNHATAAAARGADLRIVGWSCGGGDTTGKPVAALADRITATLGPGSIVLLHDHVSDPRRTLALVEHTLAVARLHGLQPVRLDTLLEAQSSGNRPG